MLRAQRTDRSGVDVHSRKNRKDALRPLVPLFELQPMEQRLFAGSMLSPGADPAITPNDAVIYEPAAAVQAAISERSRPVRTATSGSNPWTNAAVHQVESPSSEPQLSRTVGDTNVTIDSQPEVRREVSAASESTTAFPAQSDGLSSGSGATVPLLTQPVDLSRASTTGEVELPAEEEAASSGSHVSDAGGSSSGGSSAAAASSPSMTMTPTGNAAAPESSLAATSTSSSSSTSPPLSATSTTSGSSSFPKVTTRFNNSGAEVRGVAAQPDGKIVAVGLAFDGTVQKLALARYNTDGSLDTTFGTGGKMLSMPDTTGSTGVAEAVAIQGDGKILIAGSYTPYQNAPSSVVARFNANGTLDTSFGTGGYFSRRFSSVSWAQDMALQADGKILVLSRSYGSGPGPSAVTARLTTSGVLDTTFGNGYGTVSTPTMSYPVGNTTEGYGLAVDPTNGKILVAGLHYAANFVAHRYNSNGTVDTSFSGDGMATVDFGSTTDRADDVVVQADGKVVLVGSNGADFAIARLDASGNPDATFDADGKVTVDFAGGADAAFTVLPLADGKLMVGGYAGGGTGGDDFATVRLTSSGALDTTYEGSGKHRVDFAALADRSFDMVNSGGQIILAGYATAADNVKEFALVGKDTLGAPVVTINGPTSGDEATSLSYTSSVAGGATSPLTYAWSVTRDGNPFTLPPGTVTDAAAFSFTPVDDGAYVITLTVTNGDGLSGTDTHAMQVQDVLRTASLAGPAVVPESAPYVLELFTNDPGDDPVTHWTINWGDGSTQQVTGNPAAVEHVYPVGTTGATISATVHAEGAATAASNTVTFGVVPDKPFGLTAAPVVGTSDQIALRWIGLSTAATEYVVERSIDGVTFAPVANLFASSSTSTIYTYTDTGLPPATERWYRVRAKGTGGSSDESNTVVAKTFAAVRVTAPESVGEGEPYVLNLDAGGAAVSSWTITWGDGAQQVYAGSATSASHTYADGPARFSVTISADVGGQIQQVDPIEVAVTPVDATATITGAANVVIGQQYGLQLAYAPNGTDTFEKWVIDWGDGTPPVTVDPITTGIGQVGGNGNGQAYHTYVQPGTYLVEAVVFDEDGSYRSNVLTLSVATGDGGGTIENGWLLLDAKRATTADPDGWVPFQNGGSAAPDVHVTPVSGGLRVFERDAHLAGLRRSVSIPADVTHLVLRYEDLSFDAIRGIHENDAFEVSVLDATGKPLVVPFKPGRDAVLNVTDLDATATGDQPRVVGSTTTIDNTTGTVDGRVIIGVPGLAGSVVTVELRLVNNDPAAAQPLPSAAQSAFTLVGAQGVPQAPEIRSLQVNPGDEGSEVVLTASFHDANVGDTHHVTILWGDNTTTELDLPQGQRTITARHVYADNGDYRPSVTVTDSTGLADSREGATSINNVAPQMVASLSFADVRQRNITAMATVLQGAFNDPGFTRAIAGTSEHFTLTVDWGDGSTDTYYDTDPQLTVVQGNETTRTRGTFRVEHVFANAGMKTVTVTLHDDDGGTAVQTFQFGIVNINVVPQKLNLKSNGEIPVKIPRDSLANLEGIDPLSLRFGPAGAREKDGQIQINPQRAMTHFATQDSGIRPTDTVAFLTGRLTDGTFFVGMDEIGITHGSAQGRNGVISDPAPPKFFVVDKADHQFYRYRLDGHNTGYYDIEGQYVDGQPTPASANPTGIAANSGGSLLWVIDQLTHQVTITGPAGEYRGSLLAHGLDRPAGITTDDSSLWVVDAGSREVIYYPGGAFGLNGPLFPGARFALHADNTSPTGVVVNGTRLLVSDDVADQIFVYDLAGSLLGRWTLDAANADASGVTKDAGSDDLWLVDRVDKRAYRYAGAATLTSGVHAAAGSFALATNNAAPEDIADPPSLVDVAPEPQTPAPLPSHITLSGNAQPDPLTGKPIIGFQLNGRTLGSSEYVLDAAGNVFVRVAVNSAQTSYRLTAVDSAGETRTIATQIFGVDGAAELDTRLMREVTSNVGFTYGRTSHRTEVDTLFADLTLTNITGASISGPLLLAVRDLSVSSVTLTGAHGRTHTGWAYYNLSGVLRSADADADGIWDTSERLSTTLEFANPLGLPFRYELVVLAAENHAPLFTTMPVISIRAGGAYEYIVDAVDVDGDSDAITFTKQSGPGGMSVTPFDSDADGRNDKARVTWSPTASGQYTVTLTAADSIGARTAQTFVVSVVAGTNSPPEFVSTPVTAAHAGKQYAYDADAVDSEQDALGYEIVSVQRVLDDGTLSAVTWAAGEAPTIVAADGTIAWTPAATRIGQIYRFTLRAKESATAERLEDTQVYDVMVLADPANNPPYFVSTPITTAVAGSSYRYESLALDPDKDAVTYRLVSDANNDGTTDYSYPGDFQINPNSGVITWTATGVTGGSLPVLIEASDGRGGTDRQPYTITVSTAAPASITGIKWHDLNRNGIRDTNLIQGDEPDVIFIMDVSGSTSGAVLQAEKDAFKSLNSALAARTDADSIRISLIVFGSGAKALNLDIATHSSKRTAMTDQGAPVSGTLFAVAPNRDADSDGLRDVEEILSLVGVGYANAGSSTDFYYPLERSLQLIEGPNLLNSVAQQRKPNIVFVSDGQASTSTLSNIRTTLLSPPISANLQAFGFAGATKSNLDQIDGDIPPGQPITGPGDATIFATSQEFVDAFTLSGSGGSMSYTEPTLAGWKIYLDTNDNGRRDEGERHTVTDGDGRWTFSGLTAGNYVVREELVASWDQTAPGPQNSFRLPVTVTAGQNKDVGNTFGNVEEYVPTNTRPRFTTTPPMLTVVAGQEWTYAAGATDDDGDSLTFIALVGPAGMVIGRSSGKTSWIPTEDDIGSHSVILEVDDGNGGTALQPFSLRVISANDAPDIISLPIGPAQLNQPWSYPLGATDPNGDSVTFRLDAGSVARGATVVQRDLNGDGTPETWVVEWTPTQIGDYGFEVTADDGRGGTDVQRFTLPVRDDQPPSINQTVPTLFRLGSTNPYYEYDTQAFDPDGGVVTLEMDELSFARGMRWTSASGTEMPERSAAATQASRLRWRPSLAGDYAVRLTATDDEGNRRTVTYTIKVVDPAAPNEPAQITSEPTGPAVANRQWQYVVTADDPNGDAVTISVTQFIVFNGTGATGVDLLASTYDGRFGTVTRDASVPGQLVVRWTPAGVVDGAYARIQVRAVDPSNAGETQDFDLPVMDNAPPQVTLPMKFVVDVGQTYGDTTDERFTATDPNPSDTNLTYTVSVRTLEGQPITVAQFWDSANRRINWVPAASGVHEVTIVVADGRGGRTTATFVVQARDPSTNTAPVIINDGPDANRPSLPAGETYLFRVQARDAEGDRLSYRIVDGPTGMTIGTDGLVRWDTTAAHLASPGPDYMFTVEVSDGLLTDSATYNFTLTRELINQPARFTSNPPGGVIVGNEYVYQATASDPDNDALTFALVSGPTGADMTEDGRLTWTPTQMGVQEFRVRVTDPFGAGEVQVFQVEVTATNRPPQMGFTAPTRAVVGDDYEFFVTAVDPDGDALTLTASAPGSGLQAEPVPGQANTWRVFWNDIPASAATGSPLPITITVTDDAQRPLSDTQQFNLTITTAAGATNGPPEITSRPRRYLATGEEWVYDITAIDPNANTNLTFSYELPPKLADDVEGFTDGLLTAQLRLRPDSGDDGTYTIQIKASDGQYEYVQEFGVVVRANRAPTLTQPAPVTVPVGGNLRLIVEGRDADNDRLTFTLLPGPGGEPVPDGLQIGSDGRLTWTPELVGTYPITIRVEDPFGAGVSVPLTVTVVPDETPPQVAVSVSNLQPAINTQVTFRVDAVDNAGVVAKWLEIDGQYVAVDANGYAKYTFTSSTPIQVIGVATDAANLRGQSQPITVDPYDPNDSGDPGHPGNLPPKVTLTSPTQDVPITVPTGLVGTVDDPENNAVRWRVALIDPATGAAVGPVFNGTGEITAASFAGVKLDPTIIADGTYVLRVQATDAASLDSAPANRITTAQQWVDVKSEQLKIGNFGFSFTDLDVAVGGLPLVIRRSYDSLDAAQSLDFGHGWRVSVQQATLKTRYVAAANSGWGDGEAFRLGTEVIIKLPDGSEHQFSFQPEPPDDLLGVGPSLPLFINTSGTGSTLNVANEYIYYPGTYFNPYDVFTDGASNYHPARFGGWYQLTTSDGVRYTIDATTGAITELRDRQGNALTYRQTSTGEVLAVRDPLNKILAEVRIVRDERDRISKIVYDDSDPSTSDELSYEYDNVSGDLIRVINRAGEQTVFEYDKLYDEQGNVTAPLGRPHFLTRMIDGRGVAVLTAVWGEDGRLAGLRDASGTLAALGYNLSLGGGKFLESATDAYGATTETVRDSRGNIVRQIEQVSMTPGATRYLVTVFRYDRNDNRTGISKPRELGFSDRLTWEPGASDWQNTSEYGDAQFPSLPTAVQDADGNVTRYTYDGLGNVSTVTDSLGNTVSNVYDQMTGLLKQTTDPQKTVTTYSYDARGNLTSVQQKKADGTVTSVSTASYNADSLPEWTQDVTGTRQYFEYDAQGRETATYYVLAGGSITHRDEMDYDDEGRETASRRRVGGTLVNAGRDGVLTATTTTTYDQVGHVLTTTDAYGLKTINRYDARGNLVETRVPAKNANGQLVAVVTRTAYDLNGRVIAVSDPFVEGHTALADLRVTHTRYDAAGRVIETRRVGGVQIDVSWVSGGAEAPDRLGGVFAASFNYDSVNDIYGGTSAVVLLARRTQYDVNGQVQWSQSETGLKMYFGYDANGRQNQSWYDLDLDRELDGNAATDRVESRVEYHTSGKQRLVFDAVGRVVESVYDKLGRLTHTVLRGVVAPGVEPGGAADDVSDDVVAQEVYDAMSRRTATIDPLGRRTDYQYDDDGRLIAVTLPPVDVDGMATGTVDLRRPRYEYHYDQHGRQTHIVANAYLDEAAGQVVYITRSQDGSTETSATRSATAAPATWPKDKGHVTTFTYDADGRQLTRTLPLGNIAGATPGSFTERTVYVSAAEAGTVGGTWHRMYGAAKYSVDFEGRVTAFEYDTSTLGGGRLVATRHYDTLQAYQNDSTGTAAARRISYTYDAMGRQISVNDSAFPTPTTYGYDADGRVTKIDSPQGTLHYAYDTLGRQVATWTGAGETLAEARTQATTLTEHEYDQLNRLIATTAVRRFGQNVDVNPSQSGIQAEKTQTVFAPDGQVDYELLPTAGASVTKDFSYDSLGRTEAIRHFVDGNGNRTHDSGETLLNAFAYLYNPDGSRKSETWTDQQARSTTKAWTYDGLNRLVKETYDGFDGSGNALKYTDTFAFDLSSNRTTLTHDDRTGTTAGSGGPDAVVTYRYDPNDRLLTEIKDVGGTANTTDDRHTRYGYGPTDQTSKTVRQGLTETGTTVEQTNFTYDARGPMTGVSITANGTTTTVSYQYDHNNFRVERTEGGQTTVYHVDPTNMTGYAQTIEEGTDANGNRELDASEVAKVFTIAIDVITQAAATQILHLLHDAQGSTRAVLDAMVVPTAAAVLQAYTYTAFGQDLGVGGLAQTDLRYAGEAIDPLTGLSFNRARWYLPAVARFNGLDPFAGRLDTPVSLHKYLYAHADPIGHTDPSGLMSLGELNVVAAIQLVRFVRIAQSVGRATVKVYKVLFELSVQVNWMWGMIDGFQNAFYDPWTLVAMSRALPYQREVVRRFKRQSLAAVAMDAFQTLIGIANDVGAPLTQAAINKGVTRKPTGFYDYRAAQHTMGPTVFIRLRGGRGRDFTASTAERNRMSAWLVALPQYGGTTYRALRSNGWTWHHHEVVGVMQLVDSNVHNPGNGGPAHEGGVFYWQIAFNRRYRR